MTETCRPDKLTPCSLPELYAALSGAWSSLDGAPGRASILLLEAHWALETAFGHACHWYNLGNKKHVPGDGHNYTQFACGEELPAGTVTAGPTVQIVATYTKKDGVTYDSVRFLPPHPACNFVAFDSLDDGATDYLLGLRGRFRNAWPSVLAGDVAGFCHALKVAGYYTADEALYTAGVERCYRQIDALVPIEVPVEEDSAPHPDVGGDKPAA